MTQRTLVTKLAAAEGRALRERLAAEPFEFRAVPHAAFSAKGEGVVATLYRSGKLVVQGPDPDAFLLRYLGRAPAGGAPPAPALARHDGPTVGSDETGKGDFLGPLVVAAVRVGADDAPKLAGGGVVDSKQVSDARARELGAALAARFPVAVERLDPLDYNREHARLGNLNLLLADLHARAIHAIARPGDRVVVDQFGPERLVASRVADLDVTLDQMPRAESAVPAVAAASIVARAAFLAALEEFSERFAVDLAKGAGPPADRAARAFVALHGRERLGEVAKLHFRNASRVR